MTKSKHTGQTALITGASSGIGHEFARVFAEEGFDLILVSRQQDVLEHVAREVAGQYGVKATPIACDLFDPQAAQQLYQEVQQRGLKVDVLVNNAGQGQWGALTETDLNRQLDIIQLNISSLVSLTYLFLQDMQARGEGRILNVSSIAGRIPHPRMAVYAATKAFVFSFSEGLRRELKDTGITVTTLLPGVTESDFFSKADMEHTVAGRMSKADPHSVAEAGYEALMDEDDKVVAGVMNKLQVATMNILPERWVAAMGGLFTAPKDGDGQQSGSQQQPGPGQERARQR